MRSSVLDLPYGNSTKYPKEETQEADDNVIRNFVEQMKNQTKKKSILMDKSKDEHKKSKSLKKKLKQKYQNSDQEKERFPWEDRYKGKTKQKQKLKIQQKSIEYDTIFGELCYGNSTDVITAAIAYKEILQIIMDYLMQKQLEMQIIYRHKKSIKKEIKVQAKLQKKQAKVQVKEESNIKKEPLTNNQIVLQIGSQESIEVPQKIDPTQTNTTEMKIIEQPKQESIFPEDLKFKEDLQKFKRVSSTNSIISMIPYKSIPSLLLIQSLNFIIQRTSDSLINKYFSPDDRFVAIYRDLNSIAQASKKYLIEQKLKKGLRYIAEVEKKMNKIYMKKSYKSKPNTKNETNDMQNNPNDGSQFQERKISKQDQNTIIEQRKQDIQKPNSNSRDKQTIFRNI